MQIAIGYYNDYYNSYYSLSPSRDSLTFPNLSFREVTKMLEHMLWEYHFAKVELQLTNVPTDDAEVFQSRVDAHNREVDQNIAKARTEEGIE